MKRTIALFALISLLVVGMNIYVLADNSGNITVEVDGAELALDQPPLIVDGRTLVPMRAIFEALGAEVEWDSDSKSITAMTDEIAVLLIIDDTNMTYGEIGGNAVTTALDTAPTIINGRTLVPARAVAEALDCSVSWNGEEKKVEIFSKNNEANNKTAAVETASDYNKTEKTNEVDDYASESAVSLNGYFEGTYNYFGNACISGKYVYYSIAMQPYIYAYDGNNTVSYGTGGFPMGIIAVGNEIYYKNNSDSVIYSINKTSGEKNAVFSDMNYVSRMFVYNGKMYISGSDENDCPMFFLYNIADGTSRVICEAEKDSGLVKYDGRLCVGRDKALFIIKHSAYGDSSWNGKVWAELIELENGTSSECFSCKTSGAVTLDSKSDGNIAYFSVSQANSSAVYYKINLSNGVFEEISSGEYNFCEDKPYYKYKSEEIGVSGNSYRRLADNENTMVLWSGERTSANASWDASQNYKFAGIYLADSNGNIIKEIGSYTAGSGVITSSEAAEGNSVCEICGGSGRVSCAYCHGTGQGMPISVMGMTTPQSCTYCGGSGWRVCDGCGGSGEKQY